MAMDSPHTSVLATIRHLANSKAILFTVFGNMLVINCLFITDHISLLFFGFLK